MARDRALRGTVKQPDGDVGGRATKVLVSRGQSVVADATVAEDGAFDVRIPDERGLVLTIVGQDRRVLRRSLGSFRESRVDLGELELPVAEFPAGIAGQAWDAAEDHQVTGGEATLRRGRTVLISERLDADGQFSFELSAGTPLTAGSYQVLVEVPGYAPARRAVAVSNDVTSYRLGRVELTRKPRA